MKVYVFIDCFGRPYYSEEAPTEEDYDNVESGVFDIYIYENGKLKTYYCPHGQAQGDLPQNWVPARNTFDCSIEVIEDVFYEKIGDQMIPLEHAIVEDGAHLI